MRTLIRIISGLVLSFALTAPAFAEVSELRVTHQPGLAYLPLIVMEHEKLVEKEAKKRGLDLKVSWITFNSGGASADALLSGNVDLVTSGSTNLLLLWDKTGGQVKGVAAAAAIPMLLLTRNPNVKTLKDFGPIDKIAVPTVRVSTQATVLQLAAEKTFGQNETHKLDPLTVALGHPDAFIALSSGKEVDSHFSLPPYQEQELKIPGVHAVASSVDIVGGPASNGVVFGTTKFHDANPKTIAAFVAAVEDAETLIGKDKRKAAEIYLSESKEKLSVDQLVAILNEPNFVYSSTPHATLKLADLMVRAGTMKNKPASWKDYFFPEASNGPGD